MSQSQSRSSQVVVVGSKRTRNAVPRDWPEPVHRNARTRTRTRNTGRGTHHAPAAPEAGGRGGRGLPGPGPQVRGSAQEAGAPAHVGVRADADRTTEGRKDQPPCLLAVFMIYAAPAPQGLAAAAAGRGAVVASQ
jgi:hypothetical protein